MKPFKVGIDSYSLKPLGLSPFELLEWAVMNGADGVQFSEGGLPPEAESDKGFLADIRSYAAENGLYLEWGGGEHIPIDLATGRPRDIAAVNAKAARQAAILGAATVRSCSGGLMRWAGDSTPTGEFLRLAAGSLRAQASMLRDAGVTLAIETHFEFTSFELLRLFEMCGAEPGGSLGICLDTMNLLTMLEDPVQGARRLLPWVVTTHIKDGALALTEDGLVSFTAEAGTGVVDIARIVRMLAALPRTVHLSIEDHGGDFRIPVFEPEFLGRFPDLTVEEFSALMGLAARTGSLLKAGKLAVLGRDKWPERCERRVKRDLAAVRSMAAESAGVGS